MQNLFCRNGLVFRPDWRLRWRLLVEVGNVQEPIVQPLAPRRARTTVNLKKNHKFRNDFKLCSRYSQTCANDHLWTTSKPHPTKASTKFTIFIWAPYKQRQFSEQLPHFWGPTGDHCMTGYKIWLKICFRLSIWLLQRLTAIFWNWRTKTRPKLIFYNSKMQL